MTNKEKYKQAFSAIHTSNTFNLEVREMTKLSHKQKINQMVAIAASFILLIGSSTIAYATNLGGIQRTIQLWIHGDQTEVTIDFSADGSYTMDYLDDKGNLVHSGGGGVAYNPDGSERPLSQEELLDYLDNPEVNYEADGSVWIYYLDQKIDITDKFEDNVCYIKLSGKDETLYMTIKYQNGWSTSPRKYLSPSSFN